MKPTVVFAGECDDADALAARTQRAANALASLAIAPGEVVALMLRNEPVMLELMLTTRWLGGRWCLVNWHFKTAEIRHVLTDSAARVLVVHADLLAQIDGGIPDGVKVFVVQPHAFSRQAHRLDDAPVALPAGAHDWAEFRDAATGPPVPQRTPGSAMVYTSGTTGLPKGIVREPADADQQAAMARCMAVALGVEPGMRALLSAPMYHSAPASYALQCALNDALLVIEPRFDAERTLQLVESERLTHLYLVPTMYVRLLGLPDAVRRRYDLGSVRFVASTGSPCAPEIKRRMIDWWGPVIHEAYAASELGWVSHIDSADALARPGSAGRPLPGVRLEVLSDAGAPLPAGEVGLVHVRSAAVPDFSYANQPEARRGIERDGLWTLGDMGYVDADGFLFLVDRQSDMVISGGVNIYPAEIEAALLTMPGVADCAVFGIPDDEFGEALAAAVQLREPCSVDADAVRQFLRERLAGYKLPRRVDFHDALPREDTGKIFKRRLRDPFWQGRQRRV